MRFVVAFLLATQLVCGAAVAADSVVLRPQAVVDAGPVRLDAVADIESGQAESLGAIVIAHMPPGRNRISISNTRIQAVIKTSYPQDVKLGGAKLVQIAPRLTTVSADELKKMYVAQIMQTSPWRAAGRIEISDIEVPPTVSVLPGDMDHLKAIFAQREDFLGRVCLDLRFGTTQQVRIRGNVRVYATVPVSRGIKIHQPISAKNIDTKELELSAFGSVMQSAKQCEGLRAKVNIRAGQPLLRSLLEPIPVICRGETVQTGRACRSGSRSCIGNRCESV